MGRHPLPRHRLAKSLYRFAYWPGKIETMQPISTREWSEQLGKCGFTPAGRVRYKCRASQDMRTLAYRLDDPEFARPKVSRSNGGGSDQRRRQRQRQGVRAGPERPRRDASAQTQLTENLPRAAQSAEQTVKALALFAAVQATFSDVHPFCDQIVQNPRDAIDKGKPGWIGRKACARHCLTYSVGQLAAALGVTRALGYRASWSGLLAGTALNAVTHYVIDRREPLKKFLRSELVGKEGYLAHATVQRREGVVDEGGPGTALMECDQAAHRLISVFASVTTTWLALRGGRR